jgi:pimeloyl-ACP methyl ester carboxylesterase
MRSVSRSRQPGLLIVSFLLMGISPVGSKTPTLAADEGTTAGWIDLSPHRSAFVDGDGVRLNYLDWGGNGPPLILIHGIANSPHIFDDIAPLLRSDFRVLAYARRGHGHSDAPEAPYDAGVLVEDLRRLLDNLHIERASFVGWSMGGNEMTAFAGRFPDRVDRIVYLEGGYDWSDPAFFKPFTEILIANSPAPSALRSIDNLRAWYRDTWVGRDVPWTPSLEAFLRDAVRIRPNGAVDPVPSIEVYGALMETLGTWKRDYSKVRAPALAIYGTTFFPTDDGNSPLAQKLRDFERSVMVPFRRASIERVRSELGNVRVVEMDGRSHMSIGVLEVETLTTSIRDFLLKAPASAP